MPILTEKKNLQSEFNIKNNDIRRFVRLARNNPDPRPFQVIAGQDYSPFITELNFGNHFIKLLKTLGVYNLLFLSYVNKEWTFKLFFKDGFDCANIVVPKYGKSAITFDEAIILCLNQALTQHKDYLNELKLKQESIENDIEYE